MKPEFLISGRMLAGLAGAGSTLVLAGAFVFQAMGYAPCELCIWQRWPHAIALGLALAAIAGRDRSGGDRSGRGPGPGARLARLAGGPVMLISAGLGVYHTGVERHFWAGPSACTSSGVSGLDADQLMAQIMSAPLVRCDEVVWTLMGLSMASWNAIVSLVLAGLWIAAARRG